ncbi:Connective tissue growth factor CCN family member 2 [Larimichthys crocea]|uniref:Connective tissue growth factor CCN family member 2 n=1 Tax=Larimichthys crocea TaxID=215358 RepID=A0A6G0J2F4_LARCR|nr:WNT1-inducible-signaling pathway protein 2-like isoform X2 [Larimichthys crocea]KAE8297928.1 Connective tissue growth factor CCN family member 2 [Larimichthys crocea]
MMKMDQRDTQLFCSMLFITQVWCQLCTGPCQCPPNAPRCPVGVPLMLDSCGCCQVCARQEGEACTNRLPCDTHRGLQCDYSASFPRGPGQCVGQNELGCEINGRRLEEGQVFQPSCAQLCQCFGGGMTCMPLCSSDLQRPVDKCPNPQLVRPPGRCCKEWVCDSLDNSISSNPSTEQGRQDFGGGPSGPLFGSTSNCIEWTSDWSPCSHSCGPGVSTRTTNRNWACRLQTETRLCQVRPCQALLPGLRRLQPGSVVCESSYSSPLSVQFEHQGCWSTRAYRPRFCALTCPEGLCCSPSHTRTARIVFRCPQGRLTQQQVMMIESCSCSVTNCRQSPVTAGRSVRSPVWL